MAEALQSSGSLQYVPHISFSEVEAISARMCGSSGQKERDRGYKYFAEKYIFNVRVVPNPYDDGCRATARCYKSYAKNETPHKLEVSISAAKSISHGHCTCANGLNGHCGHVIGLLYQLAHFKMTGTDYIPEISQTESVQIEKETRLQTNCPQWHKLRQHRITASVVADVAKRRTDFEGLSKRLKSPKTKITQAMKDGIANEPLAAEAYSKLKGNAANLYPAGIIIHPDAFWLAVSPDRKVFDNSRPQTPLDC